MVRVPAGSRCPAQSSSLLSDVSTSSFPFSHSALSREVWPSLRYRTSTSCGPVDERIDVGQRLTLLAKLDLLKLHTADLLLAHADEALVHADVRRFGAMLAKQDAHRIGETDGLDASR